ncbi:MAG: ABC transporter ATP-binding protein [Planctomycetota bacterium]|jgi:putative ABC transport system ATP-binding protein
MGATEAAPIVRTRDVSKVYRLGNHEVHALRGVNIEIGAGEYISIMGPSGSGKSTFFNMVGGLDKPSSGKVYIREVDVAQLEPLELAWLRCREIGYIFQTFNIIPVMTALENVMLPMTFAGLSDDEAKERAAERLGRVGLGDRLDHKPTQLSGGQQQRVAIARAMANDPAIILADEPTGNLDVNTGREIIEMLRELNQESGVTVISATHDLTMIDVSDRVVYIRDGRIDRITGWSTYATGGSTASTSAPASRSPWAGSARSMTQAGRPVDRWARCPFAESSTRVWRSSPPVRSS